MENKLITIISNQSNKSIHKHALKFSVKRILRFKNITATTKIKQKKNTEPSNYQINKLKTRERKGKKEKKV